MKGHGSHDPHHHTIAPVDDDGRDPKDLTPGENADLCTGCVACCTYITVEVDAPRAAWEYDQWIWALHHAAIQMYVERPEHWFLHVETRCTQLKDDGRCAIHGRHPVLCREYDPRSCERRLPLADIRAWFHDAYELEAWIERERPSHWQRLLAYRKDRPDAPPRADVRLEHQRRERARLIPVAALVGLSGSIVPPRMPEPEPVAVAKPARGAKGARRV
jgi:Fe-S-cluster containining protein